MKKGYLINIEEAAKDNDNFRRVLYTGAYSQLVLMALKPGEEIGEEVHDTVDQFFRFEAGRGKVVINGAESEVADGSAVVVPAGAQHNVINLSSSEPLKLYTIYSPANHRAGVAHATKEEAEADDEHFDGKTTE
ncbi:MAG: cupin domain-containing protein [bacterium]|nr:cupin domain-containing protein [bacterium]